MLTRSRLTLRCAPVPPHVGHGSSITVPVPWQFEHGCEIEKIPWLSVSTPRPPHTGHTFGLVPGLAPVPWQVGHCCELGIESGTWAPFTAWSNDSVTSVSRSR